MTLETNRPERDATMLASLVNAGEAQREAIPVTDFIFMSQDVSNAYLVTTPDGDVLVNSGTVAGGPRHKALFAKVSGAPVRHAIITQSHPDHFGGLPWLRSAQTQVIVHARYPETRDYYRTLSPFFGPRTGKLWSQIVSVHAPGQEPTEVEPDVLVDDRYAFELGGRRFEILWTPEGETLDSLTVWMPNERVAFTGNLFGPVFMSMPFLVTLRGDKPRSVDSYLKSLERVRALEPELLITGHGEPIRGARRVRDDLTKLRDAVAYVRDATMAGMNAGKDVHTLMREIRLPSELQIGEFHGKTSWNVRSIWEGYSGWFHYDSTTSLYGVPRSSVDADLVELAGAEALTARARAHVAAGRPLQALHLLEIVTGAGADTAAAIDTRREALQALLAAGGGVNLSETMWLKSEIAAADKALAALR
ncbi:MAG: fold metallo-hydrolase [Phenylobacterium sp.]|nr:fold metallo-hydrolase [Phenylobacterium sp.]